MQVRRHAAPDELIRWWPWPGGFFSVTVESMDFQFLSVNELYQKFLTLQKHQLILDVRSPEEFQAGHIPHSLNLNYASIQEHYEELKPYQEIFLICRSGKRALIAAAQMQADGLTQKLGVVRNEGVEDWAHNQYPVA